MSEIDDDYLSTIMTTARPKRGSQYKKFKSFVEEVNKNTKIIKEKSAVILEKLEESVGIFDKRIQENNLDLKGKSNIRRNSLDAKNYIINEVRKYAEDLIKDKNNIACLFSEQTIKECLLKCSQKNLNESLNIIKAFILRKSKELENKEKKKLIGSTSEEKTGKTKRTFFLHLSREKRNSVVSRTRNSDVNLFWERNSIGANSKPGVLFPKEAGNLKLLDAKYLLNKNNYPCESYSIDEKEDQMKKITIFAKRLSLGEDKCFYRRASKRKQILCLKRNKSQAINKDKDTDTDKRSSFPYYDAANKIVNDCANLNKLYKNTEKDYWKIKSGVRNSISALRDSLLTYDISVDSTEAIKDFTERKSSQCFIYGKGGKGRYIGNTNLYKRMKRVFVSKKDHLMAKAYLKSLGKIQL